MDYVLLIFGEGKDLNFIQMASRAIVIFIISLVLIRISGRRSFGMRTPLDNIIVILLGALLSRAVVGASPFVPIVASSFAIVIMHRMFGWLIARSRKFSSLVEGEKIILFENGNYMQENMNRALVCKEDLKQGVRKSVLTEDMGKIEKVYIERNGEISAIKKEP